MLFTPFSIYFSVIFLVLHRFCAVHSVNQDSIKERNKNYGMELNGMKLLNISGEEKTHTINILKSVQGDRDRNICEVENPCQNGGTCISDVKNGYKCICENGYTEKNCEDMNWCKTVCGSAPCTYSDDSKIAYCFCAPDFYFDAKAKSCKQLDICLLRRINGQCSGAHETCSYDGRCICEPNYAYNDQRDCEPDFCWKHSNRPRCGENMICIEGFESFSCSCKNGFQQKFVKCVRVDSCTPGISNCEQKCRNGKCACFEGFKLMDDYYSCDRVESASECHLDCGVGTCVRKGAIEKCLCPEISHVSWINGCIDKCAAGLVTYDECPNGCLSDEQFGYTCNCTGKYDFGADGVHCVVKQMCSEGGGFEDCLTKNANCKEDVLNQKGYRCACKFGYKESRENGVCEHMCETANCDQKQASCIINSNNEPECLCSPLLIKDSKGRCNQKAKFSYFGEFLVPKEKYLVSKVKDARRNQLDTFEDINKAELLKDFEDAMRNIFDDYQGSSVWNCTDADNDLKCFLEIKLNKNPGERKGIISDPSVCLPFARGPYCLIPPNFETRGRKTGAEVFQETDRCDKNVIGKMCGTETECRTTTYGFICTCKEGYFPNATYEPAQHVLVEVCEDIDECLISTSCPNSTICVNIPGDYTCRCRNGYRLEEGSNVKTDGCTEILDLCDLYECENGICEVQNYTRFCRCYEGFEGPLCEYKISVKPNIIPLLLGVIAFCLILILLLCGTLSYVCLRKRKVY